MPTGRSLREQSHDALDRAMAAQGAERQRLIDEAARLYDLAVKEEASRKSPPDPPKE